MPTIRCPNCNSEVSESTPFCPSCGNSLYALCVECGAPVEPVAKFCGNCGAKLTQDTQPIKQMRWMCGPGELARRVEERDLEGIVRKGLIVEHGTRAVLLQEGRLAGTLDPDCYNISTFKKRFMSFDFNVPATVILLQAADIDLNFEIPRLLSKEDVELSVQCKLVQGIEKPEFFFTNLLRQRQVFTKSDLQGFLQQEITNVLQPLIRAESVKDLYANVPLRKNIEQALESDMRVTLERNGLRLIQLRFIDYLSDTLEKVRSQNPDDFVAVEAEELEQKRRELATTILSRETMEELKRRRVEADKYNYLVELDKEKLLTDQEKRELADSLEDYDLTRKFFVNKTKLLNNQKCERLINEFRRDEEWKDKELKFREKRERNKLFDEFKKTILENQRIEQDNKAAYIKQLEERGPDALIAGMDPERVREYLEYQEKLKEIEVEKVKAGSVLDEKTRDLYERMVADRDKMFEQMLNAMVKMQPTTSVVSPGGGGGGMWGHGGGPTVVQLGAQPGGSGEQASKTCPNSSCGEPVKPGEKFCGHCGMALS